METGPFIDDSLSRMVISIAMLNYQSVNHVKPPASINQSINVAYYQGAESYFTTFPVLDDVNLHFFMEFHHH